MTRYLISFDDGAMTHSQRDRNLSHPGARHAVRQSIQCLRSFGSSEKTPAQVTLLSLTLPCTSAVEIVA